MVYPFFCTEEVERRGAGRKVSSQRVFQGI
jgi:hypothetical protein